MRRLLARLTAGLLLASAPVLAQTGSAGFVVLMQGQQAGAMNITRDDGGRVKVEFSWRDNGRGPEISESYSVGPDQRPLAYQVRGKSLFGGTVQEEFEFSGGRLRWTSPADRGDEPALPDGVFVPLESSPAYAAQLLRAVLAQPGATAQAPGGAVLRAERLATLRVQGREGSAAVALYALVGVETEPWTLWLRDDESRDFFAAVERGWLVAPPGFENVGPALLAAQQKAQTQRLRTIRERTAQPLPGLTLIRGVRWFDARAALLRGPSDVYLFDGRISAVTPPDALKLSADQRIEGRGRTLLPGLWDMHVHIGPADGLMHLAAGVTAVRDMGAQNQELWKLKERFDQGVMAGPHIVAAGLIEGRSRYSLNGGIVAENLDAALAAVDDYAARGYRQVKLYNSVRPEWVKPIAARAHGHRMTVAGHVPAFMRAEQAVRAGYDELTHINQLMLNFFVKPTQDTRTLLRFTLVGDEARRVDAQGREAQSFITLLRERGTVVDPTLATFEAMFTQRDGEPNPALAAVAEHLPVLWRRRLHGSEMSPAPDELQRYRASWASMLRFTGALHRAGVPLLAGTDGTPGFLLQRELALYVRAGIPAREALRIATWNAARAAGESQQRGSILRGHRAELVLVDGDPTRDIGDLRQVSLVIQGRHAYAPAQLYEALGIRPFAPAAAIERTAASSRPEGVLP